MLLVLLIHTSILLTASAQQNLTPNGTASQSSPKRGLGGPYGAINLPRSNAFSFSICTHTATGFTEAWWMFQFSFEFAFITEIQIFYREDFSYRMNGFELWITNTSTIPPVGFLCYKDPDSGLPNTTQNIPCNELGKNVIYYDKKGDSQHGPIIELCYVAINGCRKRSWGKNCEKSCNEKCVDRHCFPGNGSCVWGCNTENCLNDICNKYTAVCSGGCKEIRRTGSYCDKYNMVSDSMVSQNPSGSQLASLAKDGDITSCSKTRGLSVTFQVDLKKESIVTGVFMTFGENTTQEGHHTVYASNDSNTWNSGIVLYNGTLLPTEINFYTILRFLTYVPDVRTIITELEVCEIGIIGCPPTHFGPYCNKTCPQNCHGPCDLDAGHCAFGCIDGWTGKNCEQECNNGSYGKGCLETCSANCRLNRTCNHVTGECINGCNDGWLGFNCSQDCSKGQFGENCSGLCDGCLSKLCHHVSGMCDNTTSCNPGYQYSEYCNNPCDDGYYGTNCTGKCNCLNDICIKSTGCKVASKSPIEGSSNGAAIGGGVAAVIIVLLVMVGAFIFYKHRFKSTKERYVHRKKSSDNRSFSRPTETRNENEYANVNIAATIDEDDVTFTLKDGDDLDYQIDHNGDENVYNNVNSKYDVSLYNILIEDLKDAINDKQKDDGFKKEYEMLPRGLVHAHVEGSKEENKVKNRFLSTWPYDHSRVILRGNTKNDYINASYIDNFENKKAYIAAQGPNKFTLRDFWHMIWQENVGKIVMVTQLIENQKKKCEQYWPETVSEPLLVNNFKITMTEERRYTFYVYRLLTVSLKNSTNMQERKIHHFHFIQWPDHGVPDSIKLVHFYRKVKDHKCNLKGPMVVHCSAGVGRTGTFIATDALYQHGQKVGYVNVMEYIEMMRKDRMNMVQTFEQYETIFEALLELFTVPNTSIPKNDFCQIILDQDKKTIPRNQKFYKVEFQRLETLRPLYPSSAFTAATLKENIFKNSTKNILAHDRYRPYLMSYGKTRSDYINAVIIPGYADQSKFLVTQCPLEGTVVDFWTMVYDHDSKVVVLLDQLNKKGQLWSGKNEVLEFEHFSIVQENASNSEQLQLTLHSKKKEHRKITVFTAPKLNVTSDAMLPSDILLDLLKTVKDCWEEQKGFITVVSSDGCTKIGLFVALYLSFEKMEIDDEVDVFQVVRAMQVRRPGLLTELEEYEYCYKCIKEYLERDSLYANI